MNEKRPLGGYALHWGTLAERRDHWVGFKKGAFLKAIAGGDVQALMFHDDRYPIGRQAAGTMKVWEDEHGLQLAVWPVPTSSGNDAEILVDTQSVRGWSIGYKPVEFDVIPPSKKGEKPVLMVTEATLREISLVTWPAMTDSNVKRLSTGPLPEFRHLKEILTRQNKYLDASKH